MVNDSAKNFSKALKYYMSANGKKQQDLIMDLKLSSATVSQWVNGKSFPRMDRIEMLASYFNISTTDLLTNPYDKPAPSANPLLMSKLIEKSPSLHGLFSLALELQEEDLKLLVITAERLLVLERIANPPEEL